MNSIFAKAKQIINWFTNKPEPILRNRGDLEQLKTNDAPTYWEAVWKNSKIKAHENYTSVYQNNKWFEGAKLNYAEHVFRQKEEGQAALIFCPTKDVCLEIPWQELETQTASFADYLNYLKIETGDQLVVIADDCPEKTGAFLACAALGIVWSEIEPSLSADEMQSILMRLQPKVIIASETFSNKDKHTDNTLKINKLTQTIHSIKQIVVLPAAPDTTPAECINNGRYWNDTFNMSAPQLNFKPLPFSQVLLIDKEGKNKSQGWLLLSAFNSLNIEQDHRSGDNIYTGNIFAEPLLIGAKAVLFPTKETSLACTKSDIKKTIIHHKLTLSE